MLTDLLYNEATERHPFPKLQQERLAYCNGTCAAMASRYSSGFSWNFASATNLPKCILFDKLCHVQIVPTSPTSQNNCCRNDPEEKGVLLIQVKGPLHEPSKLLPYLLRNFKTVINTQTGHLDSSLYSAFLFWGNQGPKK